jgi:hypothetical protein
MTQGPENSRQESFRIDGSDLMDKAMQLVDQGNKHRVVVLNEDGKSVFDIPLTVAVVGGIIVFPATAVGVIAALATRHSIVVESLATDAGNAAATDAANGTNGTDAANGAAATDASTTSSDTKATTTMDTAPYGGPTVNPPLPPDNAQQQSGGAPD